MSNAITEIDLRGVSGSVSNLCDVLIVGAGPAGIAAALTLVASGRDVLVIDKAVFPRDKCCGDGLTTGALRLLEMLGFDPTTVANWQTCSDVWLRSPSGREVQLSLPKTSASQSGQSGQFAAIAPRMELDHALVRHARSHGVRVVEGCSFVAVARQTTNDVTVTTDSTGALAEINAKYIVAADGMWSPVRKAFGAAQSGYLGEWHAFRQYVSNVTGPASNKLFVWFDADLLPGYAWSFPLPNGRANIGFGILRGSKYSVQDMKSLWPELLTRPHVRQALGASATLEGRVTAWPIPARVTSAKLSAGRALFVGDAACVADALTGEGIGQALLSGVLAGEAIIETFRCAPSVTRTKYQRKMRREFFADHRVSVVMGRIMRTERRTRAGLRIAALNSWSRKLFVRWMFEDEPRAALFSPRRWHRKFLARDGAFKASPERTTN